MPYKSSCPPLKSRKNSLKTPIMYQKTASSSNLPEALKGS